MFQALIMERVEVSARPIRQTVEVAQEILTFDEVIAKYSGQFTNLGLEAPSKTFLKHIKNSHIQGGAKAIAGKKSIFNAGENVLELAIESWVKGNEIEKGIKIFDVGRVIGIDLYGKLASKIYIVLNKTLDGVRTFYPV